MSLVAPPSLVLSSDTQVEVECSALPARWMQIPHTGIARPAFVLQTGEHATFAPVLHIEAGDRVSVRCVAAHLRLRGSLLRVWLQDMSGHQREVGTVPVAAGATGWTPRDAEFDLTPWAGMDCRLRIAVEASRPDADADWIAIIDLAVGAKERMPALRAAAFRSERAANEIAHFDQVYQHAMYAVAERDDHRKAEVHTLHDLAQAARAMATDGTRPVTRHPLPDELVARPTGAYDYAHRLLGLAIRATAPDFQGRLLELARHRADMPDAGPVRVLSLCAGAARFEAQFAAAAGAGARWTLLDLSEGLLREAARNFPEGITPTLVAADLNEVADFGERFDVVMCVSGLHHIVELERVVDFVHDVLVDDGEFWSIGEAVGRSGNRLFAGDYRVANAFFRGLPARLRRNRLGGEPDENLPNVDYSDATFEGIRSDEIEPLLAHRLEAVQVYRRNCFLWRLVDLAYADNYDLANADDIAWIHRAVDAELAHYRAGGHPTELHGVYRKRRY